MAVNLSVPQRADVLPVSGIRLASTHAGIKKNGATDLVLIEIDDNSTVSAVFTQNAFCAAPVHVAKQHLAEEQVRYLLINSGNANAGTGQQGLGAARVSCQAVANSANVSRQAVLPFSTGVIGLQLDTECIEKAVPSLFQSLNTDYWFEAAHGIMTTDTVAKVISKQVELDGKTVTVTGISKGSGMIRPDMATMLSYIATDAAVEQAVLDKMLHKSVEQSFNRISVDGDTSTNDACVLMATGHAGNTRIADLDSEDGKQLYQVIAEVSRVLAHAIVRDGEGATKFITIDVQQGQSSEECRQVAYTIAHSPLVKTAFFASDPNWGRVLAAVGRSGLTDFDLTKVDIYLDEVCLIEAGEPAEGYTEEQGQAVMNQDDITIRVYLHRGRVDETVWTCDFSYDYVKINAEYRS